MRVYGHLSGMLLAIPRLIYSNESLIYRLLLPVNSFSEHFHIILSHLK